MKLNQDGIKGNSGSTFASINRSDIAKIQIPLPPLETQRQIVDEIAAHQRIIDGARQVVEGWKPEIEIDHDWKTGKVGEVCEIKSGGTPSKSKKEYWRNGNIPWYSSGELNDFYTKDSNSKITELGLKNSNATIFPKGSLLVGMYDTAAFKMSILDRDASFNQAICGIKPNRKIDLSFLYLYFLEMKEEYLKQRVGIRQRNLSKGFIEALEIPLPPLEVQREIVARIESERKIVESNRELIRIYEEKVKKVIARVWEG